MRPVVGAFALIFCSLLIRPAEGVIVEPAVSDLTVSGPVRGGTHGPRPLELTVEALALYRSGRIAESEGRTDEAIVRWRRAAELDPSLAAPELALARTHLLRSPRTSIDHLIEGLRRASHSPLTRHTIYANLALGLFVILALGGSLLLVFIFSRIAPVVHHAMTELLARWFPGRIGNVVAVLLFAVPALWRLGLIPTLCLFAGFFWAWMRRGERGWTSVVVGSMILFPLLLWASSPTLFTLFDPDSRAFVLHRSTVAPATPGLTQALEAEVEEHPQDGGLHFALALTHERAGRLEAAEREYTIALELGEYPALVHNNLAVIAFGRDDIDEAMVHLKETTRLAPERPIGHFNLSQVYARKLFFERADEELARANKLSFDNIRDAMRDRDVEDRGTLIDERLPESAVWAAAATGARFMPDLPTSLRAAYPGSLWLLPPLALILFVIGWGIGRRLYGHLPASRCINCRVPVCRKCLRRIRRDAYCAACGDMLLRVENSAYSRMVLDSRLRRHRTLGTFLRRVARWVLPGYHPIRTGFLGTGAAVLFPFVTAVVAILHGGPPIDAVTWVPGESIPGWQGLWIAVLACSVAGSILAARRLEPPPVRALSASTDEDDEDLPELEDFEPPAEHQQVA